MTAAPLPGTSACVFDAYGTLFDYASAAAGCRDVLREKLAPPTALRRDRQLQYTWLRALQGRHADVWTVTGEALDFALETMGLAVCLNAPKLLLTFAFRIASRPMARCLPA